MAAAATTTLATPGRQQGKARPLLVKVDTASISGAMLAALLRVCADSRAMAVSGVLFGRVEVVTSLSDSDAEVASRHVVVSGWAVESAANLRPADESASDDVIGVFRMRKRTVHALSLRDRAWLAERPGGEAPRLLLSISEGDTETGSNACDYTVWQLAGDRPAAVPLSITNLVESADRFNDIAARVIRLGPLHNNNTSNNATTTAVAARGGAAPTASKQGRDAAGISGALLRYTSDQNDRLRETAGAFNGTLARQGRLAAAVREQAARVNELRHRLASLRQRRPHLEAKAVHTDGSSGAGGGEAQVGVAEQKLALSVFEEALLNSSASFGTSSRPAKEAAGAEKLATCSHGSHAAGSAADIAADDVGEGEPRTPPAPVIAEAAAQRASAAVAMDQLFGPAS